MHATTARAFGFPKAIAHGMWSKAQALAMLEQQKDWRPGPVRISCQFKKPLLLPGTAQLNWRTGESEWDFQLLNAQGNAPHLSGRIEWLYTKSQPCSDPDGCSGVQGAREAPATGRVK